jgi:hypothetical protein
MHRVVRPSGYQRGADRGQRVRWRDGLDAVAKRLDLMQPSAVLLDGLSIPRCQLGFGYSIPGLDEFVRIVRMRSDHVAQAPGVQPP